jgi:tRNA (cytosine38-C5)-methyltransferase
MGHLTALEFYSGIGGMHCALRLAAPSAAVLDAFDINHAANRCYKHNFGKAPKQVSMFLQVGQHICACNCAHGLQS